MLHCCATMCCLMDCKNLFLELLQKFNFHLEIYNLLTLQRLRDYSINDIRNIMTLEIKFYYIVYLRNKLLIINGVSVLGTSIVI